MTRRDATWQVETLLDDSIYIETLNLKRYYLKPRGADDPSAAAWTWATRLCQLTQLLGNEVAGTRACASPVGDLELDGGGSRALVCSEGAGAHAPRFRIVLVLTRPAFELFVWHRLCGPRRVQQRHGRPRSERGSASLRQRGWLRHLGRVRECNG